MAKKSEIPKKEMSIARHRRRGRAIKRYFRNYYDQWLKKQPKEHRFSLERKINSYISAMDRIGLEDLESFLSFVGCKLEGSTIDDWEDVLKVEDLMDSLKTVDRAMRR